MASDLSFLVFKLLMLSSCMLVGGQSCSISAFQFRSYTITLSAESVNESTPAVRVTWSTTAPPECVASVRVVFRRSPAGSEVTSYTTTNTSGTQVIQSPLQCGTEYYVRVLVAAVQRLGGILQQSIQKRVVVGDVPGPFIVRAEATADNTSIRVSWKWSCQGVPMHINLVRVHYQPEGGSLMMYTVDNTTATSATLPNLQCNTEYTIWVHARGGQIDRTSTSRMVSLPARASPTPTEVTAQPKNASSVRVAWQWTSSGPAPNCFNTTTVTYHPEGGSQSSLQLSDPAATETTLTDLQCNTNYTITVVATVGEHKRQSVAMTVYLSQQAPPAPTEVTTWFVSASSVRVTWKWTSSGPAPDCFNTTTVTYHPEGGDESSLQLSDPAATEATLTNLQCSTNYTITVIATAGEHRRESVAFQGTTPMCPEDSGPSSGPGSSTDAGPSSNPGMSSDPVPSSDPLPSTDQVQMSLKQADGYRR